MADEELDVYPLKVTIKGDGAAPWITAAGMDGKSTNELLNDVSNSGLLQTAAEVSALLSGAVRAVNALGAAGNTGPGSGVQSAPAGGPPSPGPQGATPAAPSTGGASYGPPAGAPSYPQPQYPQQPAPQAPPSFNGAQHPEGLTCQKTNEYGQLVCGAPVIGKQTKTGKRLWTCPNQTAKGDGHYVQWL